MFVDLISVIAFRIGSAKETALTETRAANTLANTIFFTGNTSIV